MVGLTSIHVLGLKTRIAFGKEWLTASSQRLSRRPRTIWLCVDVAECSSELRPHPGRPLLRNESGEPANALSIVFGTRSQALERHELVFEDHLSTSRQR